MITYNQRKVSCLLFMTKSKLQDKKDDFHHILQFMKEMLKKTLLNIKRSSLKFRESVDVALLPLNLVQLLE